MKKNQDKNKSTGELKAHEWLAISIILGIICAIVIITQQSPIPSVRDTGKQSPSSTQRIEVIVKGAVALPGIYRLPVDMPTNMLITLSEPLPCADLRRYQTDKPLQRGNILNVPEIKK